MLDLTVIILTKNEAIHIERCILHLRTLNPAKIFVVDSGSTDNTIEIARNCGADVYHNEWISHSKQFNWALNNLPVATKWVMRIDADEVITKKFSIEVRQKLSLDFDGFILRRGNIFLGKKLLFGGAGASLLRIWRHPFGQCEDKDMDEHIILNICNPRYGKINSKFYDYNLKGISDWVNKHNRYSDSEVSDIRKRMASFGFTNSVAGNTIKLFIKYHVYEKLPLSLRVPLFFLYRYIILLGFLDGYPGFAWAIMQCLWYRTLVDIKLIESSNYVVKK